MPIWTIQPIEQGPEVTLVHWQIFEVPFRGFTRSWTRHLAGWSCEDRHGQVSSVLRKFDPSSRCFMTASRRKYRVMGPPGFTDDEAYVWAAWKASWRIDEERDVTQEVLALLRSGPDPDGKGEGADEGRINASK